MMAGVWIQEKQVEEILQKENFQNTVTFQNLECGIEFFGFSESVNILGDLFCVNWVREKVLVFLLCFLKEYVLLECIFFFFVHVCQPHFP